MKNEIRRVGSIHSFAPGHPGPTLAAFRDAPPIPAAGIPVEAIDVDTLKPLGRGRLVATAIDGSHLMGTVAWSPVLDGIAGDGQPAARCLFAGDGSIRKVEIEMRPGDGRPAMFKGGSGGKSSGGKPGGKSGHGSGGRKSLEGVWKTISGRRVEFDPKGNVIAGHIPGGGKSGKSGNAKGGWKPPTTTNAHGHDTERAHDERQSQRDYRKAGEALTKAKADHAAAKKALADHDKKVAASHAKLDEIHDAHKAASAAKIAGLKAKLGAPGAGKGGKSGKPKAGKSSPAKPGESHTPESYAAKHGIGSANAFAHLDKLHGQGKVARDKGDGSYHVPHGTPTPKGSKIGSAAPSKSAHPVAHAPTAAQSAAARTVKTSAPHDAREAAVHAHAKASGKSAMIVTSTPKHHVAGVAGQPYHSVGNHQVASYHVNKKGHHVVSTYHRDGTITTLHHKTKESADRHVAAYVAHRIAKGTKRYAVVGKAEHLPRFDPKAHRIGGTYHAVTARVLGDGGHNKPAKHAKFDGVGDESMSDATPAMFRGGGAKGGTKASSGAKTTSTSTTGKPTPTKSAGSPTRSAPHGAGIGGCGTGKGGFAKGNTCGHKGNRNATVEAARAAHTAAKNEVLTHVKAHRKATKVAAKTGTAAPAPKELHGAIKKAAAAHKALHEARETHRGEQRVRRNEAARDRRAIKAGKASPVGAKPTEARPSLREQADRHRASKGTRTDRLNALSNKVTSHAGGLIDRRSQNAREIKPLFKKSIKEFDAGKGERTHTDNYVNAMDLKAKIDQRIGRLKEHGSRLSADKAKATTPSHTGLTSSQSRPSRTDKPSHAERVAVAAARHRQIAVSLRKRADKILHQSDKLGSAPVGHTKVNTGSRHLPGVGAVGRVAGRSPEQVELDSAAGRLAHRATKHGQRALRLEGRAIGVGKGKSPSPNSFSLASSAARVRGNGSDAFHDTGKGHGGRMPLLGLQDLPTNSARGQGSLFGPKIHDANAGVSGTTGRSVVVDEGGQHRLPGDFRSGNRNEKIVNRRNMRVSKFSNIDHVTSEVSASLAAFRSAGGMKTASKATSLKAGKPPVAGHMASAKPGGCGTGAGGFKPGNTCGHTGQRNATVEAARVAHRDARAKLSAHLRDHRKATKIAAKSGERVAHPKELHSALKDVVKSHTALKDARATHHAQKREQRNTAARERRAAQREERVKTAARAATPPAPAWPASKSHPAVTVGKIAPKSSIHKDGSARPPADPSSHDNHAPGHVGMLDTKLIHADPKRFQYKEALNSDTGSVGSLAGVKKYDHNLGGVVQVWKDPSDHKTYVVNGHNRLELANKLGAGKITVRYLDAANHKEARSIGALTNIAEGRGTAVDAAKYFRDTGLTREQIADKGIPLREKVATDGIALSHLDKSVFDKVTSGHITPERGAIIGGAGLDHHEQKALVTMLDKHKGREITNSHLKELADEVKSARSVPHKTTDLFGSHEDDHSLALHKTKLQATIKERLGKEKRLFGIVAKSKHAEDLSRAGNQINTHESAKVADNAATTLGVFDSLKNRSGPVAKTLNDAAERIHKGENAKKVTDETYRSILKDLPAMLHGNNAFAP